MVERPTEKKARQKDEPSGGVPMKTQVVQTDALVVRNKTAQTDESRAMTLNKTTSYDSSLDPHICRESSCSYYKGQLNELAGSLKAVSVKYDQLQQTHKACPTAEELRTAEKNLEALNDKLGRLEKELADVTKKTKSSNKQIDELNEEISRLKAEIAVLLADARRKSDEYKKDKDSLQAKLQDSLDREEQLNKELEKLQKLPGTIGKLQRQLNDAEDKENELNLLVLEGESARKEISRLKKELEEAADKEKELKEAQDKINKLNVELALLKKTLKGAEDKNDDLDGELREARRKDDELRKLKNRLMEAEKEQQNLMEELKKSKDADKEIEMLRKRLQDAEEREREATANQMRLESLKKEIAALRKDLNAAESREKELLEEVLLLRSNREELQLVKGKLRETQDKVAALQEQIKDLKIENEKLKARPMPKEDVSQNRELEILKWKKEELEKKIQEMKKDLGECDAIIRKNASTEKKNAQLLKLIDELKVELVVAKDRLEDQEREKDALRTDLEELKGRMSAKDQLKKDLDLLEHENAKLKNEINDLKAKMGGKEDMEMYKDNENRILKARVEELSKKLMEANVKDAKWEEDVLKLKNLLDELQRKLKIKTHEDELKDRENLRLKDELDEIKKKLADRGDSESKKDAENRRLQEEVEELKRKLRTAEAFRWGRGDEEKKVTFITPDQSRSTNKDMQTTNWELDNKLCCIQKSIVHKMEKLFRKEKIFLRLMDQAREQFGSIQKEISSFRRKGDKCDRQSMKLKIEEECEMVAQMECLNIQLQNICQKKTALEKMLTNVQRVHSIVRNKE